MNPKSISTALAVMLVAAGSALGQCVTLAPIPTTNIGLNTVQHNACNWDVQYNQIPTQLDLLLSGNAGIPALSFLPVTLSHNPTVGSTIYLNAGDGLLHVRTSGAVDNVLGGGGGLADPGSNGLVFRSALNVTRPGVIGDIPTGYPYANLSGAPTFAPPFSLLNGGWPNWVDPKQCDAVHAYCAAAVITTTTGSITTGTNQLTVGSAAGWTVGMGIGVAGAGAAGTELFTSVTAIVGTAFTLANNASTTATTQIVNHDDTVAIQAAINSGFNMRLTKGNYNVHAATNADILTISNPLMIVGDGNWAIGSVIWPRSINTQVFAIRPEITSLASTPVGTYISDVMIQQPAGFTQTGGTAFKVAAASGLSGHYVANVHIERTTTNNMCTSVVVGIGTISMWFTNNYIINGAVTNTSSACANIGGGIYFDSIQPSGDWHFNDNELSGLNTGIYIVKSDTNQWANNKINGGKLSVVPTSNGDVQRVRFVNVSIEGLAGGPTTGVTIGPNSSTQLSFIGGGIGLSAFTSGIAATATAGLRVEGMHFYNLSGTPVALTGSSAVISGNYFAGSATQISLASSSLVAIAGNLTEPGTGTHFLTSDASANNITTAGNRTSLDTVLGVGTICVTCFADKTFTVATLPACNSGTSNSLTTVSDVAAPSYNTAPTGGTPGSPAVPVYCNGTAWVAH